MTEQEPNDETGNISGQGTYPVAAIQMRSGNNVNANLDAAAELVKQAVERGARLVLLPEYFGIMGERATDKLGVKEQFGHGPQQDFLRSAAMSHRIWIIGGTVPLAVDDASRVRSACLVFAPDGSIAARYDKIHLFSFAQGNEQYDESRTIERGGEAVSFRAPFGTVALSVCYDLRFPELYRSIDDLALIVVPSAFTATTGKAHWSILLQARAIENQCYVLAAAQGGRHSSGRSTYGHSMLIDPWGQILFELDDEPGVGVGEILEKRIAEVRKSLPALQHRIMR